MKTFARPIDVIVSFSYDELTPLRFRVSRKDGSQVVVNIDQVLDKKLEKIAGCETILFKCIADGKPCELKFWKENCKWVLFKA